MNWLNINWNYCQIALVVISTKIKTARLSMLEKLRIWKIVCAAIFMVATIPRLNSWFLKLKILNTLSQGQIQKPFFLKSIWFKKTCQSITSSLKMINLIHLSKLRWMSSTHAWWLPVKSKKMVPCTLALTLIQGQRQRLNDFWIAFFPLKNVPILLTRFVFITI